MTKFDLDKAGCDEPNCTHDHSSLYLHGQCHPRRGVDVHYEKKLGHLVVCCHVCNSEVARISLEAFHQ
jgi:hypothetical protein